MVVYLGQCGVEALVTKKFQESKKENRENKNEDLFGYQEIARK